MTAVNAIMRASLKLALNHRGMLDARINLDYNNRQACYSTYVT